MIGRLSRLLRSVLQSSGEADVPLTQELALAREYLELHRLRFGDRLTIEITVDDEVAGALIPAMPLQPIVENVVQHGVARSPAARIASESGDDSRSCKLCKRTVSRGLNSPPSA